MVLKRAEGRYLGCWVGVEGNGLLPGVSVGRRCHPEENELWSGLASRQQGATLALRSQGNWHRILPAIPSSHPPMEGCLGPGRDPMPPSSPWRPQAKWGNTSPETGCPPTHTHTHKMLAGAVGPGGEGSSPVGPPQKGVCVPRPLPQL